MARANLSFDGQAYVVFDGHELRCLPGRGHGDQRSGRAKRWCSAVDLAAIRTDTAE